jgi:tRNA(Ile)-lysidine synthase
LEQFARENKIPFREDASNADRSILRNRIRHNLLPLLRRRYQPAVSQTVRRLMEIVGAESEVVTAAARAWLKQQRRSRFDSLPVAVQRRLLQLQLQQLHIAADYDRVELLRAAAGQLFSINARVSVFRAASGLVQTREHPAIDFNAKKHAMVLSGRSGQVLFDGVCIRWRCDSVRRVTRLKRPPETECFDADQIGPSVVLRHWQPGDRYQPIGMKSAVKLQDWFTNQKIPRARRHEVIVATTGAGEVFWVEGQRIAERFKLTPYTRRRLIWGWRRA